MNFNYIRSQSDSSPSNSKSSQLLHEFHCIGSLPLVLSQFTATTGWSLTYHCVDSVPDFLKTPEITDPCVSLASSQTGSVLSTPLSPQLLDELAREEDLWIPIEISPEFQKLKNILNVSLSSSSDAAFDSELDAELKSELETESGFNSGSGSGSGFNSDSCSDSGSDSDSCSSSDSSRHRARRRERKRILRLLSSDRGHAERQERNSRACLEFLSHPIGFLHLFNPASTGQSKDRANSDSQPKPASKVRVSFHEARRHASAIGDFITEMQMLRVHVWLLEMDAAATAPILEQNHTHRNEDFAYRFRRLLEYACEAVSCDAIGIYLIDVQKQVFKLRISVGLPLDSLVHSFRKFRDAQADLRAYHQKDVVVKDGDTISENAQIPEPFASGICIPLQTEDSCMGTVWFFSNEKYFENESVLQAQLLAEHFALMIERESFLRRHARSMEYDSELKLAANLQSVLNPIQIPGQSPLDLCGWTKPTRSVTNPVKNSQGYSRSLAHEKAVSGDFYDWFSIPNGPTIVALGSVGIPGLSGAILTAAVRSALRSHANYVHSASELLKQVHQTLWLQLAANARISLFCGILKQEAHYMALHFAHIGALRGIQICGKYNFKFIPLNQSRRYRYLGETSDFHCFEDSVYLKPGDSFLVFNDGLDARASRYVQSEKTSPFSSKTTFGTAGHTPDANSESETVSEASTLNNAASETRIKQNGAEMNENVGACDPLNLESFLAESEPADSPFAPSRLNQVQSFGKLETIQHAIDFKLGQILSDREGSSAALLTLMVKNFFLQHVCYQRQDQSVLTIQHRKAS